MDELIAQLEMAPDGNRDLDRAIAVALFGPVQAFTYRKDVPYTTSLDAALTLVPETYVVYQLTIWPGNGARVEVWSTHRETGKGSVAAAFYHSLPRDSRSAGAARTGPLALCIAALKARNMHAKQK